MRKLLSILIAAYMGACAAHPSPAPARSGEPIWVRAADSAQRTAVFFSGLNMDRRRLLPLARFLSQHRVDVLIAALAENDPDFAGRSAINASVWERDAAQAFDLARANAHGQPLIAVGYSLGGALVLRHLAEHPNTDIDRAILFAPPISLRPVPSLFRQMTRLLPDSINLPSLAPPAYRARDFTPVAHYSATFAINADLRQFQSAQGSPELKTLVLQSERDEFVSLIGLKRWIERNQLRNWSIEAVHPRSAHCPRFEHLIVDEESLGSEEWERMQQIISDFLKLP